MENCDCLNYCGDDPWLKDRRVKPCDQAINQAHADALRDQRLIDARQTLAKRLPKKELAAIVRLFPDLAT